MSWALLAASCALSGAAAPEVQVQSVALRGVGLLDQLLAVELCVTNPNPQPLAFRRVTLRLDVAGAPFATGSSDVPVRLPAEASTLVPFTIVTTVGNLGPQLLDIVRQGRLDYRLQGTVTLEGSLELTVPFSRRGHFGPFEAAQAALSDATAPPQVRCVADATAA